VDDETARLSSSIGAVLDAGAFPPLGTGLQRWALVVAAATAAHAVESFFSHADTDLLALQRAVDELPAISDCRGYSLNGITEPGALSELVPGDAAKWSQ